MPHFNHYTDDEGVSNIIRCGKIMASLTFTANGDVSYGNAVYLTKLKPPTSTETEIAQNNWMNTSSQYLSKTKNYFVFDISWKEVTDSQADGRNIFLFGRGNDLSLVKHKWWLKDFDSGHIIASYKYTITSFGPAYFKWRSQMGDYTMIDETVNGRPVYKCSKPRSRQYLYMTSAGNWIVSAEIGANDGWLRQNDYSYGLGPDSNVPWEYWDNSIDYNGEWNYDDVTLKAFAWQI